MCYRLSFRFHGVFVPLAPCNRHTTQHNDPDGWPQDQRPQSASAYQLWTRLRVATLGAIWRVRNSRDEGGATIPFARKAVTLAVESVVEAIKRDWLRTHTDVRQLDGGAFCNDWWRGFDVKLKVDDFIKAWADPPILCEVRGEAPAFQQLVDTRTLDIRLGLDTPVPRPGGAGQALPHTTTPLVPDLHPTAIPVAPDPNPEPAAAGGTAAVNDTQQDGGSLGDESCPICYQDLGARPQVTTICGHKFHQDCLQRWTARRATCPICRRGLPRAAPPAGVG